MNTAQIRSPSSRFSTEGKSQGPGFLSAVLSFIPHHLFHLGLFQHSHTSGWQGSSGRATCSTSLRYWQLIIGSSAPAVDSTPSHQRGALIWICLFLLGMGAGHLWDTGRRRTQMCWKDSSCRSRGDPLLVPEEMNSLNLWLLKLLRNLTFHPSPHHTAAWSDPSFQNSLFLPWSLTL